MDNEWNSADLYREARDFRNELRSTEREKSEAAAVRLQILPKWCERRCDEILTMPVSLKLAKHLIAVEHKYEGWREMISGVEKRLEGLRKMSSGLIFPSSQGVELSVGEVLHEDMVCIGRHEAREWVVSMESGELWELFRRDDAPVYELLKDDAEDSDPDDIPEPPEGDSAEEWAEWGDSVMSLFTVK